MFPPKKSGLEIKGNVCIQKIEFGAGASLKVVAPPGTKIFIRCTTVIHGAEEVIAPVSRNKLDSSVDDLTREEVYYFTGMSAKFVMKQRGYSRLLLSVYSITLYLLCSAVFSFLGLEGL